MLCKGTGLVLLGFHRGSRVLELFERSTPMRRPGSGARAALMGAVAAGSMIAGSILLLQAGAPPVHADTVESPACRIELATAWANIKEMAGRLKATSRSAAAEKCAVYRTHVQVVTHTREVLARCKTGKEREGDLAQMDGALDDVNGALGRECGGTAQFTPDMRDPRAPR
jgi:hypothetical protein